MKNLVSGTFWNLLVAGSYVTLKVLKKRNFSVRSVHSQQGNFPVKTINTFYYYKLQVSSLAVRIAITATDTENRYPMERKLYFDEN